MAYSSFLLLLIGVISYHLPEVQAENKDFWCKFEHSKSEKRIEDVRKTMVGCVGSDVLPSPFLVRLCVGINAAEWSNKTLQQKRAEVAGDMQMVQDGVQWALNLSTSQCQKDLLKKLRHHIENNLVIVNRLELQNDMVTPAPTANQTCKNYTTLTELMSGYSRLLRGKLNRLAADLKDIICNKTNGTSIT